MFRINQEYRAEILKKWQKNPEDSRGIYPPDYIDGMIEQGNLVIHAWLKANGLPAQLLDLVDSVYTLQLEFNYGLAGKMKGGDLTGNGRAIADLITAIIQDIGELGAGFDDPPDLTPNMPADWRNPARLSEEIKEYRPELLEKSKLPREVNPAGL